MEQKNYLLYWFDTFIYNKKQINEYLKMFKLFK